MSLDIRDHTIPAGGRLPLELSGKHFSLLESGGNVNITFKRRNSAIGSALNVDAPFSIGPMPDEFESVELTAVSGAPTVVKVGITDDPVEYLRVSGVVSVDTGAAATVSKVTATNVSAPLVAADNARRSIVVMNTNTTETAYINSGGAATINDFPIYPRTPITLDRAPKAAWNVIRGAAANIDLRVIEEFD